MKFAVLSLGTFCSLTPGSFGSSQTRSLAELHRTGEVWRGVSRRGDGRRRGPGGGGVRGGRALPIEGLGCDDDDRRGGLRGGRRWGGSVRRRRLSGEGIGGMFVPMSFAKPRRSQL